MSPRVLALPQALRRLSQVNCQGQKKARLQHPEGIEQKLLVELVWHFSFLSRYATSALAFNTNA